ncbi:DALR anticodon-binding domain-containing protein 3 [Adelges cooleyi]|uniref:DALR anticodon-binding domain-containing protein 3 n=1 Tax=Adelges cooleyi TaxID=133065 RepID=UPI00217F7279|nr:DALR anticodon-binding domain-containing protein 3 [Adelges cooleyi]
MYVLNRFKSDLMSFVRNCTNQEVDIKLPSTKQNVNGHIRFYIKTATTQDLQTLPEKIMEMFNIVERCSMVQCYVLIWLRKELWTTCVVNEILQYGSKYGTNNDYNGTLITLAKESNDDSVTSLRVCLLQNAVQKLAEANGCVVGSNGLDLVVSKKNRLKRDKNVILCGNVVYENTQSDYKQQRTNNVAKMSASRIDDYPKDVISKLCDVSIVYELLNVRHNKTVNADCDIANKDNGIFVMYNYSRLCQIWTAYEKGVADEYYDSLAAPSTIDFGVLRSNEEWFLIHNFLGTYPQVVRDSAKYLMSASVDVHRLCKFLSEMSSAVSLFYHRQRVLCDPLPCLLPVMYARLYLIKAAIQVYDNVFDLLDVRSVREM